MKKCVIFTFLCTLFLLTGKGNSENRLTLPVSPPGSPTIHDVIRLSTDDCEPVTTLPWSENFDTLQTGGFPLCMSRPFINTVDGVDFPSISTVFYSSPNSLKFRSNYITFAVTPEFVEPIANLQLSFWLKKEANNTNPGKFMVGVMTDPADTNTFVATHIIDPNHASWDLYEIDFQNYSGTGSYIAFKQQALGSNHYYFLDDIIVETYNPCRRPTHLTVENVTESSVTIRWSSEGIATQWDLNCDTTGFMAGTGQIFETSTDTIWTFYGLTPNTSYDVYVRSNCISSAGEWSFPISFSTAQYAREVPYIFDFEDDEENANWAFSNSPGDNKWYIGDVVHQGDEGAQALYISKNGTTHQYNLNSAGQSWAYRDIYFDPAYKYNLSFYWMATGEDDYGVWDYMKVYIGNPTMVSGSTSSALTAPAGATLLQNGSSDYFVNTSTWQHFSLDLDSATYAGKTKRLYFVWVNDGGSGDNPPAAIDNLMITATYCAPPTNLTFSFTTDDEPTFSWDMASPTDQSWEIVCVPANSNPDAGDPVFTTTNQDVVIAGLSPGAIYDAYVRVFCQDGSYSEWSEKVTFTTPCNVITNLPWRENFDSGSSGDFPVCMSRPIVYGTGSNISPSTVSGNRYSTPYSLQFRAVTMAATPEFSHEVRDLQISFQLRGEGYRSGTFTVGVMTDPTDTSTFVAVYEISDAPSNEWVNYEFSFSQQGYSDTGHYIAFKQTSTVTNYYYNIDDIEVDLYSPCSRPFDLTAHSVGSDEALVSWSVAEEVEGYEVVWGESGFDPATGDPEQVTDTFMTISNLSPMTDYDFYVRSDCDTNMSIWSMAGSFTTTQIPGVMPYFCDFDFVDESEQWAFANAGTNNWIIGSAVNAGESGEQSLYISNDGENHAYTGSLSSSSWAFRDIYFEPAREYHIHFDWMTRGETSFGSSTPSDYMKVLIGAPTNVSGGTNSYQAIPDGLTELQLGNNAYFTGQSDWAHYTTVLDESYGGSVQRIYFLWRNNASIDYAPPAAIDNFEIIPVSCFAPQQLTIPQIASDAVTVTWSPAENETEWQIVCVPFGTDPDMGTAVSLFDTTYSFAGLQPGSFYDIYVKSVCSAYEQSFWSPRATFSTLCDVISILPWNENFDALENGQFPPCMSRPFVNSVNGVDFPSVTSISHSAPNSLKFRSDTLTFAVTPEFSDEVSGLQISFYLKKELASIWPGKFIVGVMTDPADTSTFEPIHILEPEDTEWHLYELDFQSYDGSAKHIAFKQQSRGNNHYYFLDDVEVDIYNSCRRPTNLRVESVSINSATVAWTENGSATSWTIEYGPAGFEIAEGSSVIATDTIWTLSPLDAETQYDFYVTANCNGSIGEISFVGSFTTLQQSLIVPFTVDFEDDDENQNWGVANSGVNNWVIDTAVNNTPDGSKALYISNDTASHRYNTNEPAYSWAYRDVTFSDAYGFNLKFDWMAAGEYDYDGEYDYMQVFIGDIAPVSGGRSGNPVIPAGAVTLQNGTDNNFLAQNSWATFSTTLDASYAETTKRLYFLWKNDYALGNNPPAAIDNISITGITCIAPVDIRVVSVTTTTADIEWDAISATDTAWQIVWVPTGTNILNGTPVYVNNTNYTITGLSVGELYDVYVKTYCSDDDQSGWSEPVTFSTGCEIIASLPWRENFDDYPTGTFPPCMHRPAIYLDVQNSSYPSTVASNVVSAPNSLFFRSAFVTMATTPQFAEPIRNLKITFSIRGEGTQSGVLIVGVMTDPADTTTFEPIHTVNPPNRNWEDVEIGFAAYEGDGSYIAFKHVSQAQNYYIFVDDIEVSLNTCTPPTDITVSEYTSSSAKIDWIAGSDEDQWRVEWRLSSSTEAYDQAVTSTHPYTIADLQANSTYSVRVRAICSPNVESMPVTTAFTTEQGAQTFTIRATTDANSMISPSGNVQVTQGEDKTFTITANEDYEIEDVLVNNVSIGARSSYTFLNVQGDSAIHVVSKPVGIDDYEKTANVILYPNPAQTTLTVESETDFEILTLFNLMGQELYRTSLSERKIVLDISLYETGIYFIQLKNSEGIVTKKVIIQ